MVFDEWRNNYLIVYIITSWSKQNDLSKCTDVINQIVQKSKLNGKRNAFIIDDVNAKINSLR